MLKSLLSTAILATITLGFAASAHAEMKVGTLDMNNVFTQYHRTKDAETKLNEARAAAKMLQHEIKVYIGSSVEIDLRAEGGIERSQGKAKRVLDLRGK